MGISRVGFLASFLVVCFLADSAHADEKTPSGDEPAPTEPAHARWYGWQTLTSDATSLTLLSMGIATSSSGNSAPFFLTSAGSYAIGGPTIHLAHGRTGMAFVDLGMRLGSPLVFGLVGYAVSPTCSNWDCTLFRWVGATIGAGIGAISAMAVDAAVLAKLRANESPGSAPAPGCARAPSPARWSPIIAISPRGDAALGVAGAF